MFTSSDCKDIGIRQFEFVTKTQFLCIFVQNRQKLILIFNIGAPPHTHVIIFFPSGKNHFIDQLWIIETHWNIIKSALHFKLFIFQLSSRNQVLIPPPLQPHNFPFSPLSSSVLQLPHPFPFHPPLSSFLGLSVVYLSDPFIIQTWWCKHLIFQSLNIWHITIHSLKYPRYATSECKDLRIMNFKLFFIYQKSKEEMHVWFS